MDLDGLAAQRRAAVERVAEGVDDPADELLGDDGPEAFGPPGHPVAAADAVGLAVDEGAGRVGADRHDLGQAVAALGVQGEHVTQAEAQSPDLDLVAHHARDGPTDPEPVGRVHLGAERGEEVGHEGERSRERKGREVSEHRSEPRAETEGGQVQRRPQICMLVISR